MSAIDMLESQHREVEKLFAAFEKASGGKKREIFLQIADKLAVHATIEERHFYPAAKDDQTEELLEESVEEHLSVKRLLADMLDVEDDETLEAKMTVLKEQIEHHVEEEEKELFPQVKKRLDATTLDALEQEMTATQEELLSEGNPRDNIPDETAEAAPI
jgi:hemerythrin superfamily protein